MLIHPILLSPRAKFYFQSKNKNNYHHYSIPSSSMVKISCSQNTTPPQLNLSVLRFTLGIPGLDESYLPRYIGYAFGALLLLNHFVASSSSITPPQLRTEALGLSLAVFSAVIPYIGKFLKGNAPPTQQNSVRDGVEQIFVMSRDIEDTFKEDLAWASYALLCNTNSISLISVEDVLCVRGYWNAPKDVSKDSIADWFRPKIERIGVSFSDLKESVYFDMTTADSELREMVPQGIKSLLLQPVGKEKNTGFMLLASSIDYAYTAKDRAWITAIANKF